MFIKLFIVTPHLQYLNKQNKTINKSFLNAKFPMKHVPVYRELSCFLIQWLVKRKPKSFEWTRIRVIEYLKFSGLDCIICFFSIGQEGTFVKASEDLYMLIQGLLQKEPSKRIDLLELCLHPFWGDELVSLADTLDNATMTPTSRRGVAHSFLTSSNASSRTSYDVGSISRRNTLTTTNNEDNLHDTLTNVDDVASIAEEVSYDQREIGGGVIEQKLDEKPATLRPQSAPLNHEPGTDFSDSIDMKQQQQQQSLLVGSSVQLKTKEAWTHARQGTYKLERGSAVNDLTELSRLDEQQKEDSMYAESRNRRGSTNQQQQQQQLLSAIKLSSVSSFGDEKAPERAVTASTASSTSSLVGLMPTLAGGPDVDILDHLYHSSDLTVSPIAENKQLVKWPAPKWDPNVIPAPTYTPEQLAATAGVSRSGSEVKSHLKNLVAVYSSSGQQSTSEQNNSNNSSNKNKSMLRVKMHVVAYLTSAATRNEDFANGFLNDNLVQYFLHDLKTSGTPQDLKIRIGKCKPGRPASFSHLINLIYSFPRVSWI